ncbi:MAG: hypothetical protein ACXV8W_10180 [Methylobacter sp.]
MKTKLPIILLLSLGSMTACTNMNPNPENMDLASQDMKTREDHEELAEHYEEAAQDMQQKAQEYKKLHNQYETESYLYGRQAEDLKAHSQKLVDMYEKAAAENLNMARMHRQM